MQLAPLADRRSAVDTCADALRRAIVEGQLAPGSRLPPERHLAKQLGVTRVTLRSALTRLSAVGLLSVRQGSGYTVRDFRRAAGPDLLPDLARLAAERGATREVARDLLAVRRHLARGVLERLSEGVSEQARARIAAAVDEMHARVEAGGGTDEVAEADLTVVGELVAATGSAVLQLCMNPVMEVSRTAPSLRAAIYCEPRRNVEAFRELLAWLESPRPEVIDAIVATMAERDAQTLRRLPSRPLSNEPEPR